MSDFWSKRREAVEAEAAAEAAEAEAKAEEAQVEALEGLDDSEILERLGLPDPDEIGPGDDVAAFMAKAVPHHIRNRALRKLWVSNPLLANLDGLADYNEDFTGNGLNGKVLQTTYQVGKGLAAHVKKQMEEAEAAAEAAKNPEKQSENFTETCHEADNKILAETTSDVEASAQETPVRETGVREEQTRPRMRFSFEEEDQSERSDPARPSGPSRGGSASGRSL